MRTLAIAAIQTAPAFFDSEATWHRFADRVRAVCSLFPHVQMVVVPELLLAAEAPLEARADWMQEAAVPIPGPLTDRICDLAWETGLWLIPGSVYELADDDKIYNTALAVSPKARSQRGIARFFSDSPTNRPHPAAISWSSTFPKPAGSGSRSAVTARSPRRHGNSPGSAPK